MKRVLLVNPWITDFAAYDFWMKPLGLLRISTLLRHMGVETVLLDCLDRFHPLMQSVQSAVLKADGTGPFYKTRIKKPDCLSHIPRYYSRYGWPEKIVRHRLKSIKAPDLILLTSGMTYWYPGVISLIEIFKAQYPRVPILLGGIYPTLCRAHAKSHCDVDGVISGETDHQLPNILSPFLGRLPQTDIDAYIPPDYAHYPTLASAAVMTSKGCPYECPYCATRVIHPKRAVYPAEQIFQTIQTLHQQKGTTHFTFYDDALLIDKDRHFIPFLKLIEKSRVKLHFHTPNGLHPRLIDQKTADLFCSCGFMTLRLSYETCNPDRQKAMGFKVSTQDLQQAAHRLTQARYTPSDIACYVLMGLPDQPAGEVVESMQVVWNLGMRVSLASYSPIPGTRTFVDAVESGLILSDIDPLLTNNSVFPLQQNLVNYTTCTGLGTLANAGNREVCAGRKPGADAKIRNRMDKVLIDG